MDRNKSVKDPISETLPYFFHVYIDPLIQDSEILKTRKLIRASKRLNDLLYHNREGLKEIFELSKKFDKSNSDAKKGFTLESAKYFFGHWNDRKVIQINAAQIEEYFVYSMMTVHNEYAKSRKYLHLVYIEWLEFMCRLCHNGFEEDHQMYNELLAFKVEHLMKSMWQYMYKRDYWERGTALYEFVKVDQEVFVD